MSQFVIRVKQCDQNNVMAALGNDLCQANYAVGDNHQLWTVELNQFADNGGLTSGYSIISVGTGMAARYDGDKNQIVLEPNEFGNREFVWTLDGVGEGYFAINRWDREEVMDVKGDNCDPGTAIITQGWNKGDNQKWIFVPV